ncbi:hypothetical protein SUDANB15_00085 [Streptomyces sp. enrichment culture]
MLLVLGTGLRGLAFGGDGMLLQSSHRCGWGSRGAPHPAGSMAFHRSSVNRVPQPAHTGRLASRSALCCAAMRRSFSWCSRWRAAYSACWRASWASRRGLPIASRKSQPVPRFGRIDHLFSQAPDEAWEQRSCGDGAKGPRVYDWAAVQLPVIEDFDSERPAHRRWALARHSISRPDQVAYSLAYAPVGAGVDQLVRVAGRRWAIEECFQAAKNECGLDQDEVRRHVGWMRHITLAMLAHAFLAATAARAAAKGDAETVPPWSRSPWQKSVGCWQLTPPTGPTRPFASMR